MSDPTARHPALHPVFNEPHRCSMPEGRPANTRTTANISGCHYCRIADASDITNGWTRGYNPVYGVLAEVMGVPSGTVMPSLASCRAAAELTDDVAVLRMLDRFEGRT